MVIGIGIVLSINSKDCSPEWPECPQQVEELKQKFIIIFLLVFGIPSIIFSFIGIEKKDEVEKIG